MPKAWSSKDERQYEHILDSEKEQGRGTKRAKSIAAATVNKQRSKEGRTKEQQARRSSAKSGGTGSRSRSTGSSRSTAKTTRSTAKTTRRSTAKSASGRASRSSSGETKQALYQKAAKANIRGRSRMTKAQLQEALSRRG